MQVTTVAEAPGVMDRVVVWGVTPPPVRPFSCRGKLRVGGNPPPVSRNRGAGEEAKSGTGSSVRGVTPCGG